MRLILAVLSVMVFVSCADDNSGNSRSAPVWPKSIKVLVEPGHGNIRPGAIAKISVVNRTGTAYNFEWKTSNKCKGKMTKKAGESLAVKYTGGNESSKCSEVIVITATGGGKSISRNVVITTKGDPRFAELELRPVTGKEKFKMINSYEDSMKFQELTCKWKEERFVKTVVDGIKKKKRVVEAMEEVKDDIRLNLFGGLFDSYPYEYGKCNLESIEQKGESFLKISYDLPNLNSFCGYSEHLGAHKDCQSTVADLSEYDRISFILQSGDDKPHYPVLEIVGWSEFAAAQQGSIESTPGLLAPVGKAVRYEIPIKQLIKDDRVIDPREIKSIGFRFNRKVEHKGKQVSNGTEGIVLTDDFAFIRK